jgi:predicted nuclease of restriction endonuclease-like (RecB) superfamily
LDRASVDLRAEFPGQSGWSRTNLHYMSKAAETWPTEDEFVHHVGERLPWRHITVLIDRLATRDERDWYAARAAEEGWTRNLLEHWIKVGLRGRLGAAPTNFSTALDSPDSELAQQLVKDPYVFEHLSYASRKTERDVEQALMDRLQDTLMEFGHGMAFVGRQVRLEVIDEKDDTEELVLDLLLFHIPQRRFVVVELKIGKFRASYASQLGTYVAVVDSQLRDHEHHAPTVGLLLCTGKNESIVRYALATTNAPIGVAEYEGLPADAEGVLPTAGELRLAITTEREALRHNSEPKKDGSGR